MKHAPHTLPREAILSLARLTKCSPPNDYIAHLIKHAALSYNAIKIARAMSVGDDADYITLIKLRLGIDT